MHFQTKHWKNGLENSYRTIYSGTNYCGNNYRSTNCSGNNYRSTNCSANKCRNTIYSGINYNLWYHVLFP